MTGSDQPSSKPWNLIWSDQASIRPPASLIFVWWALFWLHNTTILTLTDVDRQWPNHSAVFEVRAFLNMLGHLKRAAIYQANCWICVAQLHVPYGHICNCCHSVSTRLPAVSLPVCCCSCCCPNRSRWHQAGLLEQIMVLLQFLDWRETRISWPNWQMQRYL